MQAIKFSTFHQRGYPIWENSRINLWRKNHPKGNTSEVNKEKTLYVYAMMENIKFDVGETIETSVWMNSAGKHKLGHLTLIF